MIQASATLTKELESLRVEPEIEEKFQQVLEICQNNLREVNVDMLRRAFLLSYWAHRDQRRKSGEPYIYHPLEVARIVAEEIRADDLSVAAALLHDVVEDNTDVELELIEEAFTPKLAQIIDGLTKITEVERRELTRAENVRKLILSMASDLRVILVKFADRLHNMRTLEAMPRPKQIKIATDTLDLFAPLAHRFGLFAIKSEMEDLALKILDPGAYYEIVEGLKAKKKEREAYIQRFIAPLRDELTRAGLSFDIYGRPKHIYSIYRKMRMQGKTLEEIYDLFAIRIVLHSEGKQGKEDCWRAYSIVTDIYKPLPERFRDFISVPKSNGYQSLHTTVIGPEGKRVEIQIRTWEMHQIAERGVAAHWKYKEGIEHSDPRMERMLNWIRDLLESETPQSGALDFLNDFRLNLFDEEIYVFTPKGDLLTLPKGATPIDFAFQIHTEVGLHCIGAKVNGKMVPLSYKLASGDQVEILTSPKQRPNQDWLNFVVTHKARSRIRHWVNEQRRKTIEHGKAIWEKKSRRAGLQLKEKDLEPYIHKLKFPNTQQLFFEIGAGLFDVRELITFIKEGKKREEVQEEEKAPALTLEKFLEDAHASGRPALIIQGEHMTDVVTRYATCCNPIPGDEIIGYVTRSGEIKIHRVNCKNAQNMILNHPDRIVTVEWSRQKDIQFVTGLRLVGEDRVGILSDITTIISKTMKTNIRSITVDTEDGIFEGIIVLYVQDIEHLKRLMHRLRQVEGIHGVYRLEE